MADHVLSNTTASARELWEELGMNNRVGIAACTAVILSSRLLAQDVKALFSRVDNNVFRGRQIDRQDIPKLAAAGVKTVLDLRASWGHKDWEKDAVESAGMRYVHIGLSGVFAPSDRQIDGILTILTDTANGPVFVHCRRGADRSGVVIACYRIAHDHWTNSQAMDEARQQGFSRLEVLMRRYIRHYHAKDPPVQGGVNVPADPRRD